MDSGDQPVLFTSIKREHITAENINSLFKKYTVPKNFDLLSIDIDGNDYWIWKAIDGYFPRVVAIEHNAYYPWFQSKTIKYEPNLKWDETDYYDATLLALTNLARKKGYTLVGCNSLGVNAFFVKDALIKRNFEKTGIKNINIPPQWGTATKGSYPKSKKRLIEV